MDLLQDGPDLVVPVLQEGVQVPPQRPREQQGVLAQRSMREILFGVFNLFYAPGAFPFAPYSFLLISSKFWMGGRLRGAVRLCYLTALVR